MESKSFKIWDKNNSVPRKERKIIISVRRDRIVFPKETCKAINLKEGMKLTFLQATDNPQLWFLVKSGTDGMRVCQEKNGTMHVKAATMCAELFRLSGSDGAFRVRISTTPETFPKAAGLPAAGYRIYMNEIKK